MKVEDLEKKMVRQEQYSRRNRVLIHGLKQEKNESTDDRVLKLFREELNEDVLLVDLEGHIESEKKDSNSKLHPVIVKFARYNIREKVFKSKKGKMLALQKLLLGTE